MSKTWYPMINYEKCVECGACVEHCTHGVYMEGKAPRPVVINPDNCVEGCIGCGSLCPTEAIEYFGDKTNKKSKGCSSNTGCGCSDDESSSKCCEEKTEPAGDCESGCDCGE